MSKMQKDKTLSEKLDEFEQLAAWFDTEEFSLEIAMEKFKQAEKLAGEIESELASIKNNVRVLKTKFLEPNA